MKTNKKAILGMLVAMIMSLGIMKNINRNNNEMTTQQWAAISYMCAEKSESAVGKTAGYTSAGFFGGAAFEILGVGAAVGGPAGIAAGIAWCGIALG